MGGTYERDGHIPTPDVGPPGPVFTWGPARLVVGYLVGPVSPMRVAVVPVLLARLEVANGSNWSV